MDAAVNENFDTKFMNNLETVREVQLLIDRGVQLNVSKHWGDDDEYFYYPLHAAVKQRGSGGTFN